MPHTLLDTIKQIVLGIIFITCIYLSIIILIIDYVTIFSIFEIIKINCIGLTKHNLISIQSNF